VLFSVAFAVGLAWLVTLQVHAVRRVASAAGGRPAGRTGPFGALAAVLSVLPSLLCCSPILPTVIGVLGLSATARLTTTVQLQHFFATKENLVLAGALVLLLAVVCGRCASSLAPPASTISAAPRRPPSPTPATARNLPSPVPPIRHGSGPRVVG
jgi:hypothetical protein